MVLPYSFFPCSFPSLQQEIVTEGDRKYSIFQQIFSQAQTILVVVPYISGNTSASLLKLAKPSSIWLVHHEDSLDKPCIDVINKIPKKQRRNLGSSWFTCFHMKIVIVDCKYVYIGSSNFIDETFHRIDHSGVNLCKQSYELDIWMHSPLFASYLQTKIVEHFDLIQPPLVTLSRINKGPVGKGRSFKCYFSFGSKGTKNIISNRIEELIEQAREIILSCKSYSNLDLFDRPGKKISFYTSFSLNQGSIASRVNARLCHHLLSQLKYVESVRLLNHTDPDCMWHQKYYQFKINPQLTISLLGSYNISSRSHLQDPEIMLEYENLDYSPEDSSFFEEVPIDPSVPCYFWDRIISRYIF